MLTVTRWAEIRSISVSLLLGESRPMQLERIIRTAFLVPQDEPKDSMCRWGLPTILWGLPGIGKSSRVREVAVSLHLPMEVVIAMQLEPPDVGGAIMEDKTDGGAKKVLVLSEVKRLRSNGFGVLFLDELGLAPHSIQSALQSAVLDREFGDVVLPGQVRIIAASNDSSSVVESWGLTCPMANRFCHISVPVNSVEEWGNWMEGKSEKLEDVDFLDLQDLVAKEWDGAYATSYATVKSFLQKNTNVFHKIPKDDEAKRRAWPSGRGWTSFVRTQATGAILGEPEATDTLLGGIVGEEAHAAYKQYKSQLDLPSIEDVLNGTWQPNLRLDQAYVVYTNLRAFVKGTTVQERTADLSVQVWRALSAAASKGYLDLACLVMVDLSGWPHNNTDRIKELSDPLYKRTGKSNMAGVLGRV